MFLSRMTYESLIHKLGCLKPRTTRDLLDIATNHTFDESLVHKLGCLRRSEQSSTEAGTKGKAKREDQDEGPST